MNKNIRYEAMKTIIQNLESNKIHINKYIYVY